MAYIATQAPKPDTMEDFWHMIWDEKVQIIVMLTNLEEGGRVKAHQYWPKVGSKQYGKYCVSMVSTEDCGGNYCIRTFTIQKGNLESQAGASSLSMTRAASSKVPDDSNTSTKYAKRTIYQYHFQTWPDMGVPTDPSSLLTMIDDINAKVQKLNGSVSMKDEGDDDDDDNSKAVVPPLVVHCSAGIGRTGSYVVIDSVIKKLKEEGEDDTESLKLQPILSKMRQQRPGFVQQKAQYIFCYNAIKHAITSRDDVGE
eukprot:TRINITY_DN161_c0_g1_i2.p1 TRINITY_DN161_c0_g1~~TRINITY_DN161_c0_g1_i2.p1  ORF type:complete len:255 (+),score=28.81 TRINITY_DN161_c0_g1_i2:395-1159(+)